MMIEGALNRMSLTKRTASPKRLARAYSARKVPARIPVGVPISVASPVIATVPKIALSRPPLLPGGGVIWLNRLGPIAAMPLASKVHNTNASHNRPKPAASAHHRLAERAAKAQQHAADDADPRIGQHHPPDDFGRSRTERVGALLQHGRHGLEYVAHDRGNERQHHHGKDEPGCQHADAQRRSG